MFMGLTIANIGGVPAATWIGQQIGWRMAFAATAGLGVLTMPRCYLALPRGAAAESCLTCARNLPSSRAGPVLLAMVTTVLGAGAMFTLYTYVVPSLETLTGASPVFVTLGLVMVGLGFTVGNGLGGRLADWSLDGSIKLFLAAIAAIHGRHAVPAHQPVGAAIGLFLFGVADFRGGAASPDARHAGRQGSAGPGLLGQYRCLQPGQWAGCRGRRSDRRRL